MVRSRTTPHPFARLLADECRSGRIGRREFLTRATALGLSRAAAGALIGVGLPYPAPAQAPSASSQSLRIQMTVRRLSDPRTFSLAESANVARGLLQYLVAYEADGSFSGRLLSDWEANDDATEYLLHLRPGVIWNSGAAFTADDVVANFEGWADTSVPGNSMATRLAALVDPSTGRARAGAITAMDALTVRIRLDRPDVTLIPSLAEYPAAVQYRDLIGSDPLDHGVGTGPYRILEYVPGQRAILERNLVQHYWGETRLDRVEFHDLGPDPVAWLNAAQDGQIDLVYQTEPDWIDAFDALGWTRHSARTATTVLARGNRTIEIGGIRPYADLRVRRALALAVDNAVCLELAISGLGTLGANVHVCPIQPDYAPVPAATSDPAEAHRQMEAAGMLDFEHELISVDDSWRRNTADVVAAQLQDAGFKVRRRIVTVDEFDRDWARFPFSTTNWNHRPLGIQILSLAYRSGAPWNETGFANAEFDALLDQAVAIARDEERREVMARLEALLRDDGAIIQPFWQSLYRHARPEVIGAEMSPDRQIDVTRLGFA
ncbi:MAG: ABC transporter substrate-binding protein [Rhodobacteraceae bacterium]|nr:ABC transporter substrate-binding protein [Paracoccaceae bacterium]